MPSNRNPQRELVPDQSCDDKASQLPDRPVILVFDSTYSDLLLV